MAPPTSTSPPSSADLTALVRRSESVLLSIPQTPAAESASKSEEEAEEAEDDIDEVCDLLRALRVGLLGDAAVQSASPEEVDAAASAAIQGEFLPALVTRLSALDWEGRKEAALVWQCIIPHLDASDAARQAGGCEGEDGGSGGGGGGGDAGRQPKGLEYLERHLELVDMLVNGYLATETALSCGLMIREALRSPVIAQHVLESPSLDTIVRCCDVPSFDVASDAFTTLKDLLKKHSQVVANFLNQSYTRFFPLYETLLMSDTYVTRRQSLKLLGEILLERSNMGVMMRYIAEAHNLKLMMTLLKDPSKSIQYEAFHVFKVFVANPKKTEGILKLLVRNRDKLVKFLDGFEIEKEDEDFEEEKGMLVSELKGLSMP